LTTKIKPTCQSGLNIQQKAMIQILPITDSKQLHTGLKQIYEGSFPADERREWNQWINLIGNTRFSLNEIYDQKELTGFIAVWNLDQFWFIEHFAIREKERGKGIGTQVLKQILPEKSNRVILEVEEPLNETARNRIAFYERMNFEVSDGIYYQPPYSIEKNKVKMLLMSYPKKIEPTDFDKIKTAIYRTVYQIH
jgi:ribosomal protein S18 acetylase RimI-like enzyme